MDCPSNQGLTPWSSADLLFSCEGQERAIEVQKKTIPILSHNWKIPYRFQGKYRHEIVNFLVFHDTTEKILENA